MAQKNWKGIAHSRIPHDVTDGPAWRVLSFSAKALYVDLRAKLRSTNNGNLNATLSEMKHRGWTSSATLSRALRQLETLGFIAKTRQGGIANLSTVCSLYRFTDMGVHEFPKQGIDAMAATHEYRNFQTLADARTALAALKREKSKLSKLKLEAFKSEAMKPQTAFKSEQGGPAKLSKVNKGKRAQPADSAQECTK